MTGNGIDLKTDVPHSARIYDYLLGGKDNFEADRKAAAKIVEVTPNTPKYMRANRNFMINVAHHLVADHGIRQFLDIGTGLPTAPNLHEVVQAVAPESRIVYVDNDPIVLVHARALLTSTPEGRTTYLEADLRDPDVIIESREALETFELDRPIAVSLIAIIHFLGDPVTVIKDIIDRLMRPLPPGSILALSTLTADSAPEEVHAATEAYYSNGIPLVARTKTDVEHIFHGMELLNPGVVLLDQWRPAALAPGMKDLRVPIYGGIARKP